MAQKTAVCWFEISCVDMKRATAFYSKLFGWDFQSFGDESYQMIQGLDATTMGGALYARAQKTLVPNEASVVITFRCDDITATLAEIETLGGKTLQGKTQISPEMGYAAQFLDTEGNRIGLWSQA